MSRTKDEDKLNGDNRTLLKIMSSVSMFINYENKMQIFFFLKKGSVV